MSIEFCPQLQLDWSIEEITFKSMKEIRVCLVEWGEEERPEALGRHGKDVLSWPGIYNEIRSADMIFYDCEYFNIRDDLSPGLSESDVGEGRSFQRLIESALLSECRARGKDGLFHYRIITDNEILDAVCYRTPEILTRGIT